MRKHSQAFTLLETLVALAIVVMGVAAATTVGRVALQSEQRSEDILQASMLADDAVRMLEMTQNWIKAEDPAVAAPISQYFGFTPGGSDVRWIMPSRASNTVSSPGADGSLSLRWCVSDPTAAVQSYTFGGTATGCNGFRTWVDTPGNSGIGTTGFGTTLSTAYLKGAEYVAVRREGTDTLGNVVDGTIYSSQAALAGDTASANLAEKEWDGYTRQIILRRQADVVPGVANSRSLFVAEITVKNIATGNSVQRSTILSD